MGCDDDSRHRSQSPHLLQPSSPSSESSFRELEDAFLQTQTRIWLGEVLQISLDENLVISEVLADGELLFQVSKVVWRLMLAKHLELRRVIAYHRQPLASKENSGRYRPYSNVDSFLKICKILGLTGIDLFSPSDVVEKRNTRKVSMCIRSFSKKARSKHINVPDFDVVSCTITMPKDMVGCIRRNLELSQSSFADSPTYYLRRHVEAKHRQGYSVTASSNFHETYLEESDATEINHAELQSDGLYTDFLYDSTSEISSSVEDTRVPPSIQSPFMSKDVDQLDIQSQQRIENSEAEFEFLSSEKSLHPCSGNIEHDCTFAWSSSPSCDSSHLDTRVKHTQENGILGFDYSEQNLFIRRDALEQVATPTLEEIAHQIYITVPVLMVQTQLPGVLNMTRDILRSVTIWKF
ncbi:uncharacterized protein LOC129320056 [Prosopis cineraria]|uniref:uncharacterized protein LOC129320056 n=1 Tax=Prosopis cineraria TaxID=364024 RepID=UPI00240EA29F|nr:uncharacterized protein LOC129320056 [Prosopis cineraria]